MITLIITEVTQAESKILVGGEYSFFFFAQMPITCLRFFKKSENLRLENHSLKCLTEDLRPEEPLTSGGFEPANLVSQGEHVNPAPSSFTYILLLMAFSLILTHGELIM